MQGRPSSMLHFSDQREEQTIFQQLMGTPVTGPVLSKFPLNSKPTVSVLQLGSAALTQINIVTATLSTQTMSWESL